MALETKPAPTQPAVKPSKKTAVPKIGQNLERVWEEIVKDTRAKFISMDSHYEPLDVEACKVKETEF